MGTYPFQPIPMQLAQFGNLEKLPMSIRSNAQGQKVQSSLRKQSSDPFRTSTKNLKLSYYRRILCQTVCIKNEKKNRGHVVQLGLIATWILVKKSQ